MQVDFSQQLISPNGKPLKKAKESEEIFTLLDVCLEALLRWPAQPGKNLEIYMLWRKIAVGGEIDLKAEEVVLLKDRLENSPIFTALTNGQAIVMLDAAVSA